MKKGGEDLSGPGRRQDEEDAIMLWDFLLFVVIGPLIGFFVYYLCEDRKRSKRYLDELRDNSHLIY